MKRKHFLIAACSFILQFCFVTLLQAAEDFKLVKQEGIISLYERWIPAKDGDMVREIKASFSVKATAADAVALLTNQALGTNWNTNSSEYKILKTGSGWITYMKYDIPWPMDDQDCLLTSYASTTGKITEVAFASTTNNAFPVYKKTDRINGVKGKWLFEDTGAGNIKVTYVVTTERSVKMPRWVSDPIIHNNLFKTMSAFKNTLEQ